MISIKSVSYFIPEKKLKVSENFDRYNINSYEAKVYEKIYGLQEIPCAKGLTNQELIINPIRHLIESTKIDTNSIQYLIHAHTAKVITRFGRSVIRDVKTELGLDHAFAFGTSLNNCASVLNAFEMAGMLLKNEDKHVKAIVVTGERAFTPTIQVIPNTSIMGDAAAAALISLHHENNKLLHLEMATDGRYSQGIWLNEKDAYEFEKNYVSFLSETILRAVNKVNLTLEKISWILPHNVNRISWINVSKSLQFPIEKIYLKNIKKYAHCFGSDILINFSDVVEAGLLRSGDYYLMVTVGLGATFGVAVFRF
ncbi:MAG: hypothetical protein A3F10_00365 [Coxiella sp. RIFCSPHIGHO2_12_FULL_42_15]|nr:MAG: hypothetical protein A3F10_00365 [Coxiella sp. RIFCSPHIGHO2_12_FULL_42_15]